MSNRHCKDPVLCFSTRDRSVRVSARVPLVGQMTLLEVKAMVTWWALVSFALQFSAGRGMRRRTCMSRGVCPSCYKTQMQETEGKREPAFGHSPRTLGIHTAESRKS